MSRSDDVDAWLLPGDLARTLERETGAVPARLPRPADARGSRGTRTARDWAVDSFVFLSCLLIWLTEALGLSSSSEIPGWLVPLDLVAGVVMCVALWWRRDLPVGVGLLAAVIGAFSNSASLALLVGFFSLALHRGRRWGYGVALLAQVLALPHLLMFRPPEISEPWAWTVIVTLLVLLVTTAGLMVRARRQLVQVLAQRAEEARLAQERGIAAARAAERERIAGEMHDVLAHRLSLLAVHAGALEFRLTQAHGVPVPPEQLAESIAVVRRSARLSLEELREVLQVLRADGGEGTSPPAPTLASIPGLVEEARSAGQVVTLELVAPDGLAPSASVQRTVYRVVQEGLTNARKHAPGAPVAVEVRATRQTLEVTVANPVLPGLSAAELPGAGAGQAGLRERVAVHGGTLEHTVLDDRYVLAASVPLRGEN
ncbi:histidine kinase [Serinibacter arcticus]|uniref:histidine kinase n=1 Tax=Serinibacter arcticus TaxID=1655435 RepID=A0A2U1ZUZ2_9MICO|nr:histidine kinase [Serinibacter arcticus]PWD50781.1 histidine kinase [Serinibacter arcticus]